ncbi:hypothetical protein EV192_10184 [Actinocrispum wychmicini]|uniref:Uncharacterized protein n=1 Tax=Actinocrispum wychmicini TaxID=1213861 RepID=A0A4R2K3H3_9PSEU|nr:hypothetical protein EV192_10184 [Actinocrispum wychmicini]
MIAGVLIAAGGILLVLQTMAFTRERKGSTGGTVALAGLIAFVVLLLLCVLSLTVFPGIVVWGLVLILALTSIVLLHTS